MALTSLERAGLEALRARARSPSLTASPALVRAAREIARRAAAGDPNPLARTHLRAALARALAFDPAPVAELIEAPAADVARLLARRALAPGAARATHAGVGAVERGGRAWAVALSARRTASLQGLPRDVEPGAAPTLRGRLLGLGAPAVHLTDPSGETRRGPVRTAGNGFSARLEFDAPGRWTVEVVGTGPRGPEVAAILTVSVGGAPLAAPAQREVAEAANPRAAEAQVVDAINATRRSHGLAPLTHSAAVAAVARRHSEEMATRRVLAHHLPGSGDAAQRLRRADFPFQVVRENVAYGGNALEAHRFAAEESPAHRASVLARDVTLVGCGIASVTLPSGERLVYLTELFVKPASGREDLTQAPLRGVALEPLLDVGLDGEQAAARAGPAVPAPLHGLVEAAVVMATEEVAVPFDTSLRIDGVRELAGDGFGGQHVGSPRREASAGMRSVVCGPGARPPRPSARIASGAEAHRLPAFCWGQG